MDIAEQFSKDLEINKNVNLSIFKKRMEYYRTTKLRGEKMETGCDNVKEVEPELSYLQNTLTASVDRLESLANVLSDKLKPIRSSNPSPADCLEKEERGQSSPLGQSLYVQKGRIDDITRHLESVMYECQV